jgi:hypothetical protein
MPGHTPGTGADRGDAGGGPLLVAVSLDSSPAVVRCAAQAALRLLVDLVVVHVDEARGPRFTRPDGTVVMLPIDPDLPDEVNAASIRSLRRRWRKPSLWPRSPGGGRNGAAPRHASWPSLPTSWIRRASFLVRLTKVCCTRSPDSPKGPSQPNSRGTRCGPCLLCPARIRRRTGTYGTGPGIRQPGLVDLVG